MSSYHHVTSITSVGVTSSGGIPSRDGCRLGQCDDGGGGGGFFVGGHQEERFPVDADSLGPADGGEIGVVVDVSRLCRG